MSPWHKAVSDIAFSDMGSLRQTMRPDNNAGWILFDPTSKVLLGKVVALDQRWDLSLFDLPGLAFRRDVHAPVSCLGPGAAWWLGRNPNDPLPVL